MEAVDRLIDKIEELMNQNDKQRQPTKFNVLELQQPTPRTPRQVPQSTSGMQFEKVLESYAELVSACDPYQETVRQRALGHLRGKNYHVEVEEGINWTVTPEA